MTENDRSDTPHVDEKVHRNTKELTDDADTDTTRRRLCQALSVLGMSSLAGCGGLPEGGRPGGDNGGGRRTETPTEVSSAADMDSLIQEHVAAINGKSYTVGVEFQGASTDPDVTKNIEYLRSSSGDPLVSLTEASTIDDGVESLTHYFAPGLHGVDIGFVDGTSNTAALDISTRVIEITGASVFDRFLVGAAVEEPTTTTADVTSREFDRYEIKTHQRYDLDHGFVIVDSTNVIRRFRLDWTDDDGVGRWVDVESYNIGSTDVVLPDY